MTGKHYERATTPWKHETKRVHMGGRLGQPAEHVGTERKWAGNPSGWHDIVQFTMSWSGMLIPVQ